MSVLNFVAFAMVLFAQGPWGLESRACSAFRVGQVSSSVVAKNLDFFSGEGRILINKRNVAKNAILIDSTVPLRWTSKFATLTVTGSGREFPWEGFNEMGLSVNALQLLSSQGPPLSTGQPTVGYVQWIQFILDTSANLTEAMANARWVRMSSRTTLHYFVCDSTSACAVFEYIKGTLVIYTGADLPAEALTNDSYGSSVAYYNSISDLPQDTILYKNWSMGSLARFARATIWSRNIGPSETAIGHAFFGLDNLAQNVPATPTTPGWRTFWSMAFDLTSKTFYWRTFASPQIKSVNLTAFTPDCGSGTQGLDIDTQAAGDVTQRFHSFSEADNQLALESWRQSLPPHLAPSESVVQAMAAFPTSTTCLTRPSMRP